MYSNIYNTINNDDNNYDDNDNNDNNKLIFHNNDVTNNEISSSMSRMIDKDNKLSTLSYDDIIKVKSNSIYHPSFIDYIIEKNHRMDNSNTMCDSIALHPSFFGYNKDKNQATLSKAILSAKRFNIDTTSQLILGIYLSNPLSIPLSKYLTNIY